MKKIQKFLGQILERVKFSQWLLKYALNPNIVAYILFTDEFMRNGITNFHSEYTIKKSSRIYSNKPSSRASLNVWMSIMRDHLTGLIILLYKSVISYLSQFFDEYFDEHYLSS